MGRRYRKKRNVKPRSKIAKKSVSKKSDSIPKDDVCVATRVPAEMWDRIIAHLGDSHDLHSLSQAVPVCGEFLHETKVKWLFDQVLPIVVINNNVGLVRKDVLNCRLVCKKWNKALDKLYESRTIPLRTLCTEADDKDEVCGSLGFQRVLGNYGFLADEMKPDRMAEIVNHPGILSGSPIFARYVEFTLPYETDEENEAIGRFFQKFGEHVYYVDVHCSPENGLELFGDLLHQFLQFTPNLRHLGVWKFTFFIEDNRVMTRSIKGMTREMDEFMQSELSPLKEPLDVIQQRSAMEDYKASLTNTQRSLKSSK